MGRRSSARQEVAPDQRSSRPADGPDIWRVPRGSSSRSSTDFLTAAHANGRRGQRVRRRAGATAELTAPPLRLCCECVRGSLHRRHVDQASGVTPAAVETPRGPLRARGSQTHVLPRLHAIWQARDDHSAGTALTRIDVRRRHGSDLHVGRDSIRRPTPRGGAEEAPCPSSETQRTRRVAALHKSRDAPRRAPCSASLERNACAISAHQASTKDNRSRWRRHGYHRASRM